MATKNNSKKKAAKKPTDKKIIKEVAEQIEETIEVMNGDPSVVVPLNDTFEIQEKALEETFKSLKDNKKSNRIIDRMFGYSWNGMEMDF